MATDIIQNFMGIRIAFFRPRKRVYFIFEWSANTNTWHKSQVHFVNLSLHRSRQQEVARCTLHIRGNRDVLLLRGCQAQGHYLMAGESAIPIVSLTGHGAEGRWPASFTYPRELTCTDTIPVNYELDRILWTVTAPVVPPLALPVTQAALITRRRKIPIPRRIAWLVAEDTSKTETCAICMENLSPITASVTTCFHTYHTDCINEWFVRNNAATDTATATATAPCPVCREACVATKAYDDET